MDEKMQVLWLHILITVIGQTVVHFCFGSCNYILSADSVDRFMENVKWHEKVEKN